MKNKSQNSPIPVDHPIEVNPVRSAVKDFVLPFTLLLSSYLPRCVVIVIYAYTDVEIDSLLLINLL